MIEMKTTKVQRSADLTAVAGAAPSLPNRPKTSATSQKLEATRTGMPKRWKCGLEDGGPRVSGSDELIRDSGIGVCKITEDDPSGRARRAMPAFRGGKWSGPSGARTG